MMLEPGDDDLVIFLDVAMAPTLGTAITGPGGAANEDDLSRRRSVQEAAGLFASALIGVGSSRRERVCGTMNVGIFVLIEIRQAIDDCVRLLRSGSIVEPDQRTSIDTLLQDREILTN